MSRNEELLALAARASELASEITFSGEPQLSHRTRLLAHEAFEKLSNFMDQAFKPVWSNHVGSLLDDKERKRCARSIYFPIGKDADALRSRLGSMRAVRVYDQGGPFRGLIDHFQPHVTGDKSFYVLRAMANMKHEGLAKAMSSTGPAFIFSGVPGQTVVLRKLKILHRVHQGVNEYQAEVDGGMFNPITGKDDLPLPPGTARIGPMTQLSMTGVPGEVSDFVSNAVGRLVASIAYFEREAGVHWSA